MNHGIRVAAGFALTSSGLPLLAQPAPPASSASQPPAEPVKYPVDPTWLVADVVIALVIGVVVGYLAGARRGRTAGHA